MTAHPLLDLHDSFAWDMDETLINGPNSSFFRDFIAANGHKRHFIVTFRTPRPWADEALGELASLGLNSDLITAVSSVPDRLYEAWAMRKRFYDAELVGQFVRWKGKEAARLGCTVLIDDMIDQVILGCTEHKVTLINSYDRAFGHPDFSPDSEVA